MCPIVGGQFFAVNGSETFSLADLKVPGTCKWETEEDEGWWEADSMQPGMEFIRAFRTDYLAQDKVYTYITEGYIKQNFFESDPDPDLTDYQWAIGWWLNDSTYDYLNAIENHYTEMKVDESKVTFKNGTAFVGNFFDTHDMKIQSSGAVATKPFGYESDFTVCPIIGNQLPVAIDLSDVTVPGTCKWETEEDEGWWEADSMQPGMEFVRFFRTDYLAQAKAYTYITEGYIKQNFFESDPNPDLTDYAWAIGWWENDSTYDYLEAIENHYTEKKVTAPVEIKAGYGFICNVFDTHNLVFNFPSALDVPSKK